MGIAAFAQIPRGDMCTPAVIGTLGAFYEPSPVIESKLIHSDEKLIRELILMLDKQLLVVLDTRTLAEFEKTRLEVWPKYVRALRALSDTMSNLVSENDIEKLSEQAMSDLAKDIEKQRSRGLGNTLIDQAAFTLWTLGKIRSLGRDIHMAGTAPDGAKEADLALNKRFRMLSSWTQFHLDITISAIKFGKTIPEDIQGEICDGLRATVDVYAIMKEALYLRKPQAEITPIAELPWDEEDETLLSKSMRDINAFSDDH
jgi:hypothetical protein